MYKHRDDAVMAAADSNRGYSPPHTDEEDEVSKPLVHYNKKNPKAEKHHEGERAPQSKERDAATRRDTGTD